MGITDGDFQPWLPRAETVYVLIFVVESCPFALALARFFPRRIVVLRASKFAFRGIALQEARFWGAWRQGSEAETGARLLTLLGAGCTYWRFSFPLAFSLVFGILFFSPCPFSSP